MLNKETLKKTRVAWFFVCRVLNKERSSAKVKTRVTSRHPSSSAIPPSSWLNQETHSLLMSATLFLRHLETLVTPVRLVTEATTFHSDKCVSLKLPSNPQTMFCIRPSLTLAVERPALYGSVFSLQSCSLTWDLVRPQTETFSFAEVWRDVKLTTWRPVAEIVNVVYSRAHRTVWASAKREFHLKIRINQDNSNLSKDNQYSEDLLPHLPS